MYKGALYATIADPEGNIVYSRDIKLKGKFTYTSQVAGEHRICLQTNSSGGWFSSKQVVSSNCWSNQKTINDLQNMCMKRKSVWILKVDLRHPTMQTSLNQNTCQVKKKILFFFDLIVIIVKLTFLFFLTFRSWGANQGFEWQSSRHSLSAKLYERKGNRF